MLSEFDHPGGRTPRVTDLKGRATSENVIQDVTQTVTQSDPTNAERQRRWRKNHPSKHRVQQRRAYARKREAERAEEVAVDPWTALFEREKLAREAQAQARAAGMSARDWLAQKPAEERQEWAGVEELLAVWERVDREVRESDAIAQALYYPESDDRNKAAAQEAARRMRELNISREEMIKEGYRNSGFSFDRVLEARRRKAALEVPL